ncbi:hypothetical protein LCGC14_0270860 [marine sediment metagenome]|uniref:Uncharacterized protein n=1 Tax=marine sediment metagenome TaxID=412755 RepID=A0A0F9UFR7_9ZZZZ
MNEAQFLLSLGMKPKDLSDADRSLSTPALIKPKYAMVENGDPDGLVVQRDHNKEPVPHSRRMRAWV